MTPHISNGENRPRIGSRGTCAVSKTILHRLRVRPWEQRTFEESVRTIDTAPEQKDRWNAFRVLRYLGTDAAAEQIVNGLTGATTRSYGDATDWSAAYGLYGSRDRAHVIDVMDRAIDRPDANIGTGFIATLAMLDITHRSAARPIDGDAYNARVRALSIRRLGVLKNAGRLRGMLERSFAQLVEHGWLQGEAYTSAYATFPHDVEAAFTTLTPIQQQSVLSQHRNWLMFRDPAFVPMLRRLATGPTKGGPQDIALRLLYDLDPAAGRGVALLLDSPLTLRRHAERDQATPVGLVDQPGLPIRSESAADRPSCAAAAAR